MPLPIKLWGRLPKKGHVKMQSVHPTLMSRRLCERLGLMRAAHMGLLSNYLDFPLENHSPNSLLAAETSFPAECLFFFHDVKHIPRISAKLCHSSLCPGESPHNVNVVSVSTLTFSVPCSWSQKTKGPSSKDPPSTLFPPSISSQPSSLGHCSVNLSLQPFFVLLLSLQTSVSHVS